MPSEIDRLTVPVRPRLGRSLIDATNAATVRSDVSRSRFFFLFFLSLEAPHVATLSHLGKSISILKMFSTYV